MPDPKGVEAQKTGYGDFYQESVEIEAQALFGLKEGADELYRRQVGLVTDEIPDSLNQGSKLTPSKTLDSKTFIARHNINLPFDKLVKKAGIRLIDNCNLNLGHGKRVLDIAVGEGDTSRYLATTGAAVEARDLSQTLIEAAKRRDQEIRTTSQNEPAGIAKTVKSQALNQLGEVIYGIGDMGKIKDSLEKSQKFDVVSIMSRSFIYLLDSAKYQQALQDYFDLLSPGGKIVIQSREHIKNGDLPWSEELKTSMSTEGGDFRMTDHKTGKAYAWRDLSEGTSKDHRKTPDGLTISKGSRYFIDPDGTTHEMQKESFESDDLLSLKFLPRWKEMLEKAGFKKVGIKAQELSPDGTEIMYAIVAEKPEDKKVTRLRERFRGLLKKVRG